MLTLSLLLLLLLLLLLAHAAWEALVSSALAAAAGLLRGRALLVGATSSALWLDGLFIGVLPRLGFGPATLEARAALASASPGWERSGSPETGAKDISDSWPAGGGWSKGFGMLFSFLAFLAEAFGLRRFGGMAGGDSHKPSLLNF